MSKPRAHTPEEVRKLFLQQIQMLCQYWAAVSNPAQIEGETEAQARCQGIAFSILNILDGGSSGLPAMDLVLAPHDSDKEYHKSRGENWFKRTIINDCQLHEEFMAMLDKEKK